MEERRTGPSPVRLAGIIDRIREPWFPQVQCGPGWDDLLAELDARITALDPDYAVQQVKEKFGTLRYYVSVHSGDEEIRRSIRALINDAEQRSARTCENCGSPGSIRTRRGWFRTLCDRCASGDDPWRSPPVGDGPRP